jgi:hypothetical protein
MLRHVVLAATTYAAAGCATDEPDHQGTYRVQVTGSALEAFPAVRWPEAMDVVLVLDAMGEPRLTLQGLAPREQEVMRSATALDMRTLGSFPLSLVNRDDCDFPLDWTGDSLAIITYHFEDGRVEGHTSGNAYCQRRPGTNPDSYIARFTFDLVGERVLPR